MSKLGRLTELLIFGVLGVLGIFGVIISFKILAPNYNLDEDFGRDVHLLENTNIFTDLGRAGSGSWMPIWALFGYFEPTVLEKSLNAVPVMTAIFLLIWQLISVILVSGLIIHSLYVADMTPDLRHPVELLDDLIEGLLGQMID